MNIDIQILSKTLDMKQSSFKIIIHHDQVGIILRMQHYINIQKSINVMQHINRVKDQIASSSQQMQTKCLIKSDTLSRLKKKNPTTINRVGIEEDFLNLIMGIQKTPQLTLMIKDQQLSLYDQEEEKNVYSHHFYSTLYWECKLGKFGQKK